LPNYPSNNTTKETVFSLKPFFIALLKSLIMVVEKREAMGLSPRDASRLSGVPHTHIRDIEDGRSTLLM